MREKRLRKRALSEPRMSMSASWSFEDELTIALLSTMDSRSSLHASASTACATCSGSAPAAVGLSQLDVHSKIRVGGRAILRKLKAWVL